MRLIDAIRGRIAEHKVDRLQREVPEMFAALEHEGHVSPVNSDHCGMFDSDPTKASVPWTEWAKLNGEVERLRADLMCREQEVRALVEATEDERRWATGTRQHAAARGYLHELAEALALDEEEQT